MEALNVVGSILQVLVGAVVSLAWPIAMIVIWMKYLRSLPAYQVPPNGAAPPCPSRSRHPEPIARWTREACAVIDRGGLYLDDPPQAAATMLSRWWNVRNATQWIRTLVDLLGGKQPITAWDGVRAIRVLMAGVRIGFADEAFAWAITYAIGRSLAQRYASFDGIAAGYLKSRRVWGRLPADGSGDDDDTRAMIAGWTAHHDAGWRGVRFGELLEAAFDPAIVDLADARRALEARLRPAPPQLPRRARCGYCKNVGREGSACARCGAPIEDARAGAV